MAIILPGTPNLSETVAAARRLGASVEAKRGTGELIARHPAWDRPITVNGRRKDTPLKFLLAVRRLAA